MTRTARLASLRLQGFKSFAERTVVEFGPGVNAVVGPNGSGKSNLADALRWSLGEQGRALRSRKSEDVIFAGSDRRHAVGMADVTLVFDNADGLLPVDFSTVEIGRRLYRSGENEYLLNRQRVRLRDLEDLLDAANLAENAFLFIGQGMVDQALALRPEERRPLFEEVAGVRRHDRRRRRAEDQLTEAEANLARVADLIAELRPQARRLAAQAEQQRSRTQAGDELATALVTVGHHRWHEAATRVAAAKVELARVRAEADGALAAERAAEEAAAAAARRLAERDTEERDRRAVHDTARARLTEARLRRARLDADAEAAERDRARVEAERGAAEAALAEHRRSLALEPPPRDEALAAELARLEASRSEALAELSALRARRRAAGEALAATIRAEETRRAERESADRRAADLERRAEEARIEAAATATRAEALRAATAAATATAEDARAGEAAALAASDAARAASESAEAARSVAAAEASGAAARLQAARATAAAARARVDAAEARGMARAVRRLGGRAITDGLEIDPALRAAVTAALRDAEGGYVLPAARLDGVSGERGVVVVEDAPASGAAATREAARAAARAAALGGGALADAVRRDATGAVRRILARRLWVPALADALALAGELGPGWAVATPDGALVDGEGIVVLGGRGSALANRADAERATAEEEAATGAADAADAALAAAARTAGEARSAAEAARGAANEAAARRRRCEEEERTVARDLERVMREEAWQRAQWERLASDSKRARAAATELAAAAAALASEAPAPSGTEDEAAIASWERRLADVTERYEKVLARAAEDERARAEVARVRARAEASAALAEERIAAAERAAAEIAARIEGAAAASRDARTEEDAAVAAEAAARATLDELSARSGLVRGEVRAAEEAAAAARQRSHAAEDRLRRLEVADVEARLALDGVREQLLVELAALGDVGLVAVASVAGMALDVEPAGASGTDEAEAASDPAFTFEEALARAGERWAAEQPEGEAPSAGRVGTLRRRFNDVGASNPFAVEEYAEIRARLDGLESQDADLRSAIEKTRALIRELETLIADRFRTTFARLEGAFDAQFRILFGGGSAQLSLTDPTDLAATGVEIVARPPGKKAQALAMLSGGERALTAVALLFAMLQVRPVPFCVLDEVDAALDEANIGRFSEALSGLAVATQFIVITHNRGTIEAADALYGITIGDDAVSHVISLRLEEAREIADASRPAGAA